MRTPCDFATRNPKLALLFAFLRFFPSETNAHAHKQDRQATRQQCCGENLLHRRGRITIAQQEQQNRWKQEVEVFFNGQGPGPAPVVIGIVLDEQPVAPGQRDQVHSHRLAVQQGLEDVDDQQRTEERVIGRPDLQPSAPQKAAHVNGSAAAVLRKQQARDEEAAKHEEQIDPDPTPRRHPFHTAKPRPVAWPF